MIIVTERKRVSREANERIRQRRKSAISTILQMDVLIVKIASFVTSTTDFCYTEIKKQFANNQKKDSSALEIVTLHQQCPYEILDVDVATVEDWLLGPKMNSVVK